MGNWEFYDDEEDLDISESEKEPSFSFYDFKKWLSKQKRQPLFEAIEEDKPCDDLREQFKNKMRKRAEEKIEKKLKERKH